MNAITIDEARAYFLVKTSLRKTEGRFLGKSDIKLYDRFKAHLSNIEGIDETVELSKNKIQKDKEQKESALAERRAREDALRKQTEENREIIEQLEKKDAENEILIRELEQLKQVAEGELIKERELNLKSQQSAQRMTLATIFLAIVFILITLPLIVSIFMDIPAQILDFYKDCVILILGIFGGVISAVYAIQHFRTANGKGATIESQNS